MRIDTTAAALFSLPVLAAGARHHNHAHGAVHSHGVHRRALEVEVITVTEVVYHTVTASASSSASQSPSSVV